MAVELDNPFTTSRPLDDSYATILDLEQGRAVRRGRERARAHGARVRQGRDQGQDGRDVDEVHRHRRGDRAGRRRAHASCCGVKSREAGGQGFANATVTFALSEGGGTIHTNAQITRQGGVDGRGRGDGRAGRADHRLQRQARRDLRRARGAPSRCARSARARCRATAARRCRTTRTGPCSTATGPTTTCACSAATCWRPSMDAAYMTKKRAREVRPVARRSTSRSPTSREPRRRRGSGHG